MADSEESKNIERQNSSQLHLRSFLLILTTENPSRIENSREDSNIAGDHRKNSNEKKNERENEIDYDAAIDADDEIASVMDENFDERVANNFPDFAGAEKEKANERETEELTENENEKDEDYRYESENEVESVKEKENSFLIQSEKTSEKFESIIIKEYYERVN